MLLYIEEYVSHPQFSVYGPSVGTYKELLQGGKLWGEDTGLCKRHGWCGELIEERHQQAVVRWWHLMRAPRGESHRTYLTSADLMTRRVRSEKCTRASSMFGILWSIFSATYCTRVYKLSAIIPSSHFFFSGARDGVSRNPARVTVWVRNAKPRVKREGAKVRLGRFLLHASHL
jgi:hypothetical protein